MTQNFIPWDWNAVNDKSPWLTPCEESYYYANKWRHAGKQSVLDLGCGLGRHALLFAKAGFCTTGVDISKEAINHLKAYSRENNVNILAKVADMQQLPFHDDAFDCVFSMHAAGHCDTAGMKIILSEIKRVLKPEGSVFLTLCSKDDDAFADALLNELPLYSVLIPCMLRTDAGSRSYCRSGDITPRRAEQPAQTHRGRNNRQHAPRPTAGHRPWTRATNRKGTEPEAFALP